jgi:hypothetical protein
MLLGMRLLLLWLVMATIPLQGLAAASMLLCRAAGQDAAAPPLHGSGPAHAHVGHAQHADGGEASAHTAATPAEHVCLVCASCCHGVAISEFPLAWPNAGSPHGGFAEPFVLIHSVDPTVPDKPPRA